MHDDYKPNETREQYILRREAENMYAKFIENPPHPTTFVQRVLTKEERIKKFNKRKANRNAKLL